MLLRILLTAAEESRAASGKSPAEAVAELSPNPSSGSIRAHAGLHELVEPGIHSAVGAPALADEIHAIVDGHDELHAHIIDTSHEGRLTAERAIAVLNGHPRELSVFMCGPAALLTAFETQFRRAGVASRRIHREYLDWR